MADHYPDLATYLPALQMLEALPLGNAGRIRAIVWQAVFQHMMEIRRQAVHRSGQHYAAVEKTVTASIKRLRLSDPHDPYLEWVATFARFLDACDNPGPWAELRATMKAWSSS